MFVLAQQLGVLQIISCLKPIHRASRPLRQLLPPRVGIPISSPGFPSFSAQKAPIMDSEETSQSRIELYDSSLTMQSDSETYPANNDFSPASELSSTAITVYQPPLIWRFLRGAAINLLLPFINGLMLGFGELFAHEAAFRLGWSNTKVSGNQLIAEKYLGLTLLLGFSYTSTVKARKRRDRSSGVLSSKTGAEYGWPGRSGFA